MLTDIVLLPELWNVGYASPDEYQAGRDAWEGAACTLDDRQFSQYVSLAQEKQIAIVLPFLERNGDGSVSDAVALIDIKGKTVERNLRPTLNVSGFLLLEDIYLRQDRVHCYIK